MVNFLRLSEKQNGKALTILQQGKATGYLFAHYAQGEGKKTRHLPAAAIGRIARMPFFHFLHLANCTAFRFC